LYHVPNFQTKVNLLSLLLGNPEVFTKAVVYVNTRLTAEKLYNNLKLRLKDAVAILNPIFFESAGISNFDEFFEHPTVRVLLVANELKGDLTVTGNIAFIIHAELPSEKEVFISRIVRQTQEEEETLFLTLSTDLELPLVRKIEQSIGQRFPVEELPENVLVKTEQVTELPKPRRAKAQEPQDERGAAFHEKKASNAKNYNYSSGLKAKMNKKKKHG
jgi:ATP-dependent RNA helicase RhlE